MSRWRNWSRGSKPQLGFTSFITEAGRVMPGDPEQIAQQNGWTGKNFGWYQDSGGQIVARNVDGQMIVYDEPPTDAQTQIDQGNPTPVGSALKPADRARSLGLQSNGKGGYVDPKTGQTVARTVNNELVFYDSGPGGGVVSDGAGGQNIATSQPSWQDPVTGLIVVPPAQPETPQELAAIPDAVPSQAPQSFSTFVQDRKLQLYMQNKQQKEAETRKEAIFSSSPATKQFVDTMTPMMDKAMESGDEHRIKVAEKAKELLDQNLEDISSTFEKYNEFTSQPDFQNAMKFRLLAQAREAVHNENLDQIMGDESLSDEDKQLKTEVANTDETTGPASWEPLVKRAQEDLDMYDRIMSRREEEKERDKIKEYHGDLTDFTVSTNEEERAQYVLDVATANGFEPTGEIKEVSWDVAPRGKEEGMEKEAAFDALRTWRNTVLPELEIGTVVVNYPNEGGRGGNIRTRIYKLAGFGDEDENGMQSAIVVDDGQGGGKLVPVDGQEQAPRLRESIVQMILAGEGTDLLYEQLFQ